MKVIVLKERSKGEPRVAATPETVKKIVALGLDVSVEKGAGDLSAFPDQDYKDAGATIFATTQVGVQEADIVLKVRPPLAKGVGKKDELSGLKKGALLIALLDPYRNENAVSVYAKSHLSAVALELIPRISRAQSMDVLSSQANLAGYRAVIEACYEYGKAFPLMMTAAGTVRPAKVLVLGAGVAGLQAIATAKRLGAVVSAFDVRAAVKEQVKSLGAKFVEVEEGASAETKGGYAKEMSAAYKKKQEAKIFEAIQESDVVVTTALIPGKPAPKLVSTKMIKAMKPGSVIVDMAVENGGNVEGVKAESVVEIDGVKVVGYANLPGRLASEASTLYARNVFNFLTLIWDKDHKKLTLDLGDEIVKGALLTHEGAVIHEGFKKGAKPAVKKSTAKKATPTKKTVQKSSAKKTTVKKKAPAKKALAKKASTQKGQKK